VLVCGRREVLRGEEVARGRGRGARGRGRTRSERAGARGALLVDDSLGT